MTESQTADDQRPPIDTGAYQAWLFDLDGVLTKTAQVHAAAWKQAFDRFLTQEATRSGAKLAPFDATADYEKYVDGKPREDGVRDFLTARGIELAEGAEDDSSDTRSITGLAHAKNDLMLDMLKRDGITVYDGAVALVKQLRASGVLVAVVSASENTVAALTAAGIAELFDACIDGNVVKDRHLAGKPAPDSYLEAARVLAVDPSCAVVIEDAVAGVAAGKAGSFGLVVGVDNHHDKHHADALHAHGADIVVTDLAELLGDNAANTTS